MATQTTSEFFALLKKSGVFESPRLESLSKEYSEVTDVRSLARNLVNKKVLSEWQAKLLLSGRHKLKVGAYILRDRMPKQPIGDRFVALHQQLDRRVDVLIFPSNASENKAVFKQFLKKAAEVAELNHPNLMQLYDIDQDGSRYYLVFEHDEGDSLQNMANGSLTAKTIAGLAQQCLDGIGYAHERGIIHGKIDESQIRVRGRKNEKVSLRNMGLANLLDQLADNSSMIDEFAVSAQPTDDINAIGRIAQTLFTRHVGQPMTDSDKHLLQILEQVNLASDSSPETIGMLSSDLKGWLATEKANQQKTAASQAAPEILEPLQQTVRTAPATSSAKATTKANARKAGTATKSSKKTTVNKAAQRASVAEGKKRLAIIGASFLAVCGVGYGIYSMTGSSDSDSQAKVETKEKDSSTKDASRPQTTKTANSDTSKKSGKKTAPTKSDEKAQKWSPPSNEEVERTAANRRASDPPQETVAKRPPFAIGDATPTTDMTPDPQQEEATKPETATTDSAVGFPGTQGWPLISWENAKDFVGQEVVVYGVIQSVGGSGPRRFMNFKSRANNAFTVVVHTKDWDISESKLRTAYDDTKVLVKGRMEIYKPKDQPQINVTSADQILPVDDLPVSTGQPMFVGGSGGVPMGMGTDGGTAMTPVASGAFAKVGNSFGLTTLTREHSDFSVTELCEVDPGESPLALFLTVPEEASERDVFFELVRDEATRKSWDVYFSPRTRDAEKNKYVIGQFVFEDNKIGFRWKEGAEFNPLANLLRNCLVQLKTESDSKTVLLRDPVLLEPLKFEEKKPRIKERMAITDLPRPDSIVIEFLPYAEDQIGEQIADLGTQINVDQKLILIVFDKLLENQFFRVQHSADISTTIKLESTFQLNLNGQIVNYSTKNLRLMEQALLKLQAETNQLNTAALEYDPPKGSIRDHNRKKKEISAQLELVNAQVAAFLTAKPKAAQILAQKAQYRVLYNVGDIQFELARTKEK